MEYDPYKDEPHHKLINSMAAELVRIKLALRKIETLIEKHTLKENEDGDIVD